MSQRITTGDIITEICESNKNVSPEVARLVIDGFIVALKNHILKGDRVLVWNFGLFRIARRSQRKAHDILAKDIVIRAPKDYPKFEFSKNFLAKFNDNK